jgi:hypothetical protein
MKSRLHTASFVLLCLFSGLASAHPLGYSGAQISVTRIETHRGWEHRRGGYGHRHHHGAWVPFAAGVLLGSTAYWAATSSPSVSTVIVSPPTVVVPPPRVAYFCQTSQQYYPVVPVCDVPWMMVNY